MNLDIASEHERNRLLRRADWRFLLPNPRPSKSICFAGGSLRSAVSAVSGCMVDPHSPPSGDCDLAVGVNPDCETLGLVHSALRPGGACYTEWFSPLSGGAGHVRDRLRAAGFEDVVCYWAWPIPSLGPALFWLPMQASGALSHYFQTRPRGRGPFRHILQVFARGVGLALLRAGWLLPVCSIARKPLDLASAQEGQSRGRGARFLGGQSGISADWVQTVRASWSEWGFGAVPRRLGSILLTGGHRSSNKVVSLVFGDQAREPSLVIKQPRRPESIPGLRREALALEAVHRLRPGGMPGVPRLLFSREYPGGIILGESALAGSPLYTQLKPDNCGDYAIKAADWLVGLAGQSEPRSPSAWWDRLVEPVLRDFGESFAPIIDRDMLQVTRGILGGLPGLPLVCEQRDFSPWNIQLGGDGSLVVLDWESAELQGLPGMDLFYYLAYQGFFQDGAMKSQDFETSYRAMIEGRSASGRVMAECLAYYARRLHLDPAALNPLRLLVWMLHSRSEYHRIVEDTNTSPGPVTLRRSLFYRLWQEELTFARKEKNG